MRRLALLAVPACLMVLAWAAVADAPASPSCDQVVAHMVAMNQARFSALHSYTSYRHYHVEYSGLGHEAADMDVRVDYSQPGPKQFTVTTESGSSMLRRHVLDPLLKAEQSEKTIDGEQGSAINPKNYTFALVDSPRAGQPAYVLQVAPQHESRYLFRGKIWVNPDDFGIERAEGTPADDLSWWVSKVKFDLISKKVGDFWLPVSDHTVSHVRFFGHATLDITYHDFDLTAFSPVGPLSPQTVAFP